MSQLIPDFGKYAVTIWVCYGVSLGILSAFTIHIFRQNKKYKP